MGQIDGQVAIVTGGGGSLGSGIAKRFAREGAIVIVVDRDSSLAGSCAREISDAGGKSLAVPGDCSEPGVADKICADAVLAYGRVDILVNAQFPMAPWAVFPEKPAEDFAVVFEGSVVSAVRAMQAVFPHMRASGSGRIVNLGSMYGPTANEGVSDATTMDGALLGLTKSVGIEWSRYGIMVNFLQAAVPDIAEFHEYRQSKDRIVDHLIANLPMPRLADPVEDIGGAAMFLVSDEACFIAGHKVLADGGQHLVAAVFEPGATR